MESLYSDAWRLDLASYIEIVSGGAWKRYAWLDFVCKTITDAILSGKGAKIIVEAPPRHGKTHTISEWLPVWFLDLFPEKRVILCSYADSLAKTAGRRVRDQIQNNDLVWADISRTSASVSDWETTRGGGERTAGINGGNGGGITGRGFDLGIIDDYNKDWAEASSPATQQKIWEWYETTFSTRAEDENAVQIIMATRWNQGDLIGRLVESEGDEWTRIRLPSLAEENDLLGRAVDAPLCPERWSFDALAAIRSKRPHMFAALYQQRPSPADGNVIKRDWIRYYGGMTTPPLPEGLQHDIQSWDMNFKETAKGSFVVGQAWGSHGANMYLLGQKRGRWSFTETKKKLRHLSEEYPEFYQN